MSYLEGRVLVFPRNASSGISANGASHRRAALTTTDRLLTCLTEGRVYVRCGLKKAVLLRSYRACVRTYLLHKLMQ